MNIRPVLALILLVGFLGSKAYSGEIRNFYRGARATAMGGAFTAVADDEQAIFLNPAGLVGIHNYQFHYAVGNIEISQESYTGISTIAKAFSSFAYTSLNSLLGKNLYVGGNMTSSIVMPGLGISLMADAKTGLTGYNKAFPFFNLDYQMTYGVQTAMAFSLLRGFKSISDFRLGVAPKVFWRKGGIRKIEMIDIFGASKSLITEKMGSYHIGYGGDIGLEYVRYLNNHVKVTAGATYLDVGDTNFGTEPDRQKGNMKVGTALWYRIGQFKAIFAYDYQNILDQTDWRKKNHLGVDLSIPFLSIYGGVNQVSLSYGAGIDLWLFKLSVLSYAEEIGSYVFQNPERRWMAHIALKFNL